MAVRFGYYPGCTLETSAVEYDLSMREVCRRLGMEFVETEDWNCCGASPVAALDPALSILLSSRNLAIAERQGTEVLITPCSGCYNRTARAARLFANGNPNLSDSVKVRVEKALAAGGCSYKGRVSVRHPLDLFVKDIGLEAVRSRVTRPLKGLKVVCYYGCLLTRPSDITAYANPTNPTTMDELVTALGAKALPFQQKTSCCGGPILLPKPEVALAKTKSLLDEAFSKGADCILSPCPLCSMNLDGKQSDIERSYGVKYNMPVLYFTQLMGLAFGLSPWRLGFQKNMVSTKKIWKRSGNPSRG